MSICMFDVSVNCVDDFERNRMAGCKSCGYSLRKTEKHYHGHPMFYEIVDELKDLHSRKNADYAGDDPLRNLRMCEEAGIPSWKGVIVRLTDKMSRLMTFAKKESFEVKDESVEDTFCDSAVYSILGLILYRESKMIEDEKRNGKDSIIHDNQED